MSFETISTSFLWAAHFAKRNTKFGGGGNAGRENSGRQVCSGEIQGRRIKNYRQFDCKINYRVNSVIK